jgi:hypothetical protein
MLPNLGCLATTGFLFSNPPSPPYLQRFLLMDHGDPAGSYASAFVRTTKKPPPSSGRLLASLREWSVF